MANVTFYKNYGKVCPGHLEGNQDTVSIFEEPKCSNIGKTYSEGTWSYQNGQSLANKKNPCNKQGVDLGGSQCINCCASTGSNGQVVTGVCPTFGGDAGTFKGWEINNTDCNTCKANTGGLDSNNAICDYNTRNFVLQDVEKLVDDFSIDTTKYTPGKYGTTNEDVNNTSYYEKIMYDFCFRGATAAFGETCSNPENPDNPGFVTNLLGPEGPRKYGCSKLMSIGDAGDLCRLWQSKMYAAGNDPTSTVDAAIDIFCSKHPEFIECDCSARDNVDNPQNVNFELGELGYGPQVPPQCWWRPCKNRSSYLITSDLFETKDCAKNVQTCTQLIQNIAETSGTINVDLDTNIDCTQDIDEDKNDNGNGISRPSTPTTPTTPPDEDAGGINWLWFGIIAGGLFIVFVIIIFIIVVISMKSSKKKDPISPTSTSKVNAISSASSLDSTRKSGVSSLKSSASPAQYAAAPSSYSSKFY